MFADVRDRSVLPRLPAVVLALALAMAGCSTAPTLGTSQAPAVPAAFKAADPRWTTDVASEAQPRGAWWTSFGDPVLDDLIGRASRNNTSIRTAAARLAQARATLRGAEANRRPQGAVTASVSRQGGPLVNAAGTEGNLFALGTALSYELDLSGRLARAGEAAALDARSRDGLLQSTRLLVQADVAHAYLQLRALDAERALVSATADAYRETLRLTERRFRSGLGAELDVERARTELAAIEADLLALQRQRALMEHTIALLAGEVATSFAIAPAEPVLRLPSIPPGVPSAMLARRADVAAARDALQAAQARLGMAQAAWFPNLSLTASGGLASSELGELLRSSARAWGLGALLALPLFDGGRRQAGVDIAAGDVDAMAAGYHERILVAFRDVEDQLSTLGLLAAESAAHERALASAQRAREMSESRYRNGLVSQLELLDAQRTELRHRRQAAQLRFARHQATVGLIRALGGDWSGPAVATAAVLAPVAAAR